ncbi:MAG: peptidoglycan-associated lipoprotein Pal [Pseudomonadota bacterium]
MRTRPLIVFAALLTLGACSSTDEEALTVDTPPVEQREDISGSEVGGVYGESLSGDDFVDPNAGTQAELVSKIGDRIFFGYDRYDLSSEAQAVLEAQAEWLKTYSGLEITIEGHADERGTREYNLALGERRANSVRNYLVALGVAPDRINTISYGKERPAVAGSNAKAWAQNRRGVVIVD